MTPIIHKGKPVRKRLSITMSGKLYEWIEENTGDITDGKRFRTVSDAIDQGIFLLKENVESKK